MSNLTTKTPAKVGQPVEASDGRKGIAEQVNPDGAIFVRFPDEKHVVIVWGPKPVAAESATEDEGMFVSHEELKRYEAEMDKIRGVSSDRLSEINNLKASLAKANAEVTDLQAKLAAATKGK